MSKGYILGPFLIIIAAWLWSLDGFLRQALYTLPPLLIVFLEHLLGFLVTVPILIRFWPDLKLITKKEWLSVGWVAIFGGILGTWFYTRALGLVGDIDLSVVVLLQKLQPLFAISLAMIILKERPKIRYWLFAILALIGGYLITFKGLWPHFSGGGKQVQATLLAVGAAFAWGSSTVFGRRALQAIDFRLLTSLRFGLTALLLIPLVFTSGYIDFLPQLTSRQWLMIIAIVFSTGLLALFIYYAGLRRTRASIATICEMFWPVSAVVLDYFVNHTILTATQAAGAVLLLFAIYKISTDRSLVVSGQS